MFLPFKHNINIMDKQESSKLVTSASNQIDPKVIKYAFGVIFGILSAFLFHTAFSEEIVSDNFFISLVWAISQGLASFFCFYPIKRTKFLVGAIELFSVSILTSMGLFNNDKSAVIGTIISFFIGLSLLLRFFNTTLLSSVKKIAKIKATQVFAKIILWGIVVLVGLLLLAGIFSWIAGLSATGIIIILLILILLK